ncbi:MAG: hypothetical protein AB1397_02980 [bacterium]
MERQEMEKMSNDDLNAIITMAQEIIAGRNGKKLEIHLYSHSYKGSGKCWVARIDEYKKILGFVEPHTVIPDGYRREKVFFLPDGQYLLCSVGSKSHDNRRYITVRDGQEVKK